MRIIRGEDDIKEGVRSLVRADPNLARVHALAGDPPLRLRPGGFEGLAATIVNQQLSVASAAAIWSRLLAKSGRVEPPTFLALTAEDLREVGLSRGKIETLRRVAEAMLSGALDLGSLETAPEETIHAALTALKGVGPWTADIYIMFSLGRADAWSPGDLALQHAVRDALALSSRPSLPEMAAIAERWRPWRAVAARLLWSFYALRRKRAAEPVPAN